MVDFVVLEYKYYNLSKLMYIDYDERLWPFDS